MRRPAVAVGIALLGAALLSILLSGGTAAVTTPAGERTVAVADTPEERRTGLMNRSEVPHDGMLFVFPDARPRTFWMKDTNIPLDIVFIGPDTRVLNVAQADPDPGVPADELPRYRSDGAARYVLEVPQGDADRLGLTAGAEISISRSPVNDLRQQLP